MSELHKFLFEGLPVRGMLVKLTDGWREALARREAVGSFPPEVRVLLGQMSAAGVLMQSNIKFNGALVLQVMGDGPVKLAVAEVQHDLSFRATAKVIGEVPSGAVLPAMLNLHGQGRCAITLDPKDRLPGQQPYQGIVPLNDEQGAPLQDLAAVLEHYMLQSEQLSTKLVLAANDEMAAGLLIQHMPVEGEGNLEGGAQTESGTVGELELADAFNRISMLAATLTAEELLTLDSDTILRRLFWEEDLRRFEPQSPKFACTCSQERVSQMLRGLGRDEVESVIAEQGSVEIDCDFCGKRYHFDAVDAGRLFVSEGQQMPGSDSLQ